VTIELVEVLARLEGRVSSMVVSPSESKEASLSELFSGGGLGEAGWRMEKGILEARNVKLMIGGLGI
jgi:hypothetical protein